jgi:hypothetical protein
MQLNYLSDNAPRRALYYFTQSNPDDFTCQGESAATQWVKINTMLTVMY